MAQDGPDNKGFGEDVLRTPEEVARDEGKGAVDKDAAAKEKKEKEARAREEFNLNEADHRRNPHG